MKTFRLATININTKFQKERLHLLESAFTHSKADFICVQEVILLDEFKAMAKNAGYFHSVFNTYLTARGVKNFTGIISKTPLVELNDSRMHNGNICFVGATLDKTFINLASAHFTWGSHSEPQRLELAEQLDNCAKFFESQQAGSFTVLGGDLNAEPNYRSLRYLLGQDLNSKGSKSTLWTDAWRTSGSKENEATTSAGTNTQARTTAFNNGIAYPGLVPDRRIDYILTHGWRYGKPGGSLSFDYLRHPDNEELSDHNGLIADMILEV